MNLNKIKAILRKDRIWGMSIAEIVFWIGTVYIVLKLGGII